MNSFWILSLISLIMASQPLVEISFAKSKKEDVIADINGTIISQEVFSLYMKDFYGNSPLILKNMTLKKRALNELIRSIITTQAAEFQADIRESVNQQDLKAIEQIYKSAFFKQKLKNGMKSKAVSSDTISKLLPKKLVSYYKFSVPQKAMAEKTHEKIKKSIATLKVPINIQNKFLEFAAEYGGKAFIKSRQYTDSYKAISELEKTIIDAKKTGLYEEIIKTDFGYEIVLIYEVLTPTRIHRLFAAEYLNKYVDEELSDHIKNFREKSKISINEEQLEKVIIYN
jgi:hypothetical protein